MTRRERILLPVLLAAAVACAAWWAAGVWMMATNPNP